MTLAGLVTLAVWRAGVRAAGPAGGGGPAESADHLFPERAHDFGTAPRGAVLLKRFRWTNTEGQRLEIVDVRTSCTCVSVNLHPRAVEPGQSGVVEVLVDGRKFVGQKTYFVHLTVQGERQRIATLQAAAHVRPDVVYNPAQVNFGQLSAGTVAKQVVEIEYAGTLDWRITELAQENPWLEVTIEEMSRRPGEAGYRVQVALKPDCPPGELKTELLLKTNDPNLPVSPLLVEGTVRPLVTAAPALLSFGLVRKGQSTSRRIAVRGDRPFRITKVEGGGDELEIAVNGSSSPILYFVNVTWQPGSTGELQRTLVLHTDCPQQPVVSVPVIGQAVP